MEDKIIHNQSFTLHLPSKTTEIAIAVSGGADSMCMAKLCQIWAKQHNCQIVALIVNHKLRPESSKEATTVQARLKKLGIKSEILVWEGPKPKSNIQEVARKARYKLLIEYCKSNNIKHLVVAHNKNDQAETILMRILRGTGVDGLSGMKVKQSMNGITLHRPLLAFSRDQIIQTLKHFKIKWVEDPSNKNEKYLRIRIRKLIESQKDKSQWIERLNLLSSNAKRTRDYLEKLTRNFISQNATVSHLGYVHFKLKDLEVHEELKLRVLSKLLMVVSGRKKRHRLSTLSALNFTKKTTLWDCIVIPKNGICYIIKEPSAVNNKIDNSIWDGRFKIKLKKEHSVTQLTADDWRELKDKISEKPIVHDLIYSLPVVRDKSGVIVGCPLIKNLDVKIDFIKKL